MLALMQGGLMYVYPWAQLVFAGLMLLSAGIQWTVYLFLSPIFGAGHSTLSE